MGIDAATVTRGVTYLFRCWIQREFGLIPEAHIRRGGEATLICKGWALVASGSPVEKEEISRLKSDLQRPVFAICPDVPGGVPGFDLQRQRGQDLTRELLQILQILEANQDILRELGEENPEREEWWRTRDAGDFKLWKRGQTRRLLLYPEGDEVYGFSITESSEGGDFFFRSKSCREEGRVIKSGRYKMSEHALPSRKKVSNLDLLFSDGKLLLIRLLPTGAGFKVFPRRIPGMEGSLD